MNISSKITGDPLVVSQGFFSKCCLVFFAWSKISVHFHWNWTYGMDLQMQKHW